jgi:putative DNA methylase
MIEIPPKFAGRPAVNPESRGQATIVEKSWRGAQGLAEDMRYYGRWMRDEAEKRIGHLYPKVEITSAMVQERPDLEPYQGRKLTVIAWLWARTVKSPNPAFADVGVPLASTFMLSTKKGKEAYVEPVIEERGYRFVVKVGRTEDAEAAKAGTKLSRGANFRCLMSGTLIDGDDLKPEGQAKRMGARLMAIVVEGDRGRVYIAPFAEHEITARNAKPEWTPKDTLPHDPRAIWCPLYGLTTFADLFTPRQLVALTTFSDLVGEAMKRIRHDAVAARLPDDDRPLRADGTGATAYAEAVGVYLAFAIDKMSDRHSTLGRWDPTPTASGVINTFSRQALPMTWAYAEGNPFSEASGNFQGGTGWIAKVVDVSLSGGKKGCASNNDASVQSVSMDKVVSTDPPYYDNIGYADLSDFFYVWLRRSLKPVLPDLFATLAVPKTEELVATPYRHGSKEKAETFFLDGMTKTMRRLAEQAHPAYPVSIYYAFKQSETKGDTGISSTGWETFLDAVILSGFTLTGTWPMRTELGNRMIGIGTNALASSIGLVCRQRPADAPMATRREFVAALRAEFPTALAHLQSGNIAPVDLAQAAIGPGMAVFTRYAKVLDEVLAEQEGEFDPDSRWALAWFEQQGFDEGEYGVAETLSKAKNTSIAGIVEGGILASSAGKVRLLRPDELADDWDPTTDARLPVWEAVHHLIRALETGGEPAAARVASHLGASADIARELAYRLYTICERKRRAAEALSYNSLVQSWPEIADLARQEAPLEQGEMFGGNTGGAT